jgi:hypothetical protein
MARATEADVKAIIDTALTEEEVSPFLATANVLVSRAVRMGGGNYDADELREAECWCAAWLLASRDPRVKSEKAGDGEWSYDIQSYWEKVVLLDPTGQMASMKEAKTYVDIQVLG